MAKKKCDYIATVKSRSYINFDNMFDIYDK